jgi:hypothetical protein
MSNGKKKKGAYRRETSASRLGLERRLIHIKGIEGGLAREAMRRRRSKMVRGGPDIAGAGAVVVVSVVKTLMRLLRSERQRGDIRSR